MARHGGGRLLADACPRISPRYCFCRSSVGAGLASGCLRGRRDPEEVPPTAPPLAAPIEGRRGGFGGEAEATESALGGGFQTMPGSRGEIGRCKEGGFHPPFFFFFFLLLSHTFFFVPLFFRSQVCDAVWHPQPPPPPPSATRVLSEYLFGFFVCHHMTHVRRGVFSD